MFYCNKFKIYLFTGLCAVPVAGNAIASPAAGKPNVILILADDMAKGDISCYNGGLSSTPNIDLLLEKGVVFNNAYSSAPVSAPARASLLTGMYPHSTGCVTLNLERYPRLTRISEGIPTMADLFRANGYVTGLVGKWHCGIGKGHRPIDRGFDVFEGYHGFDLQSYNDYYINEQEKRHRVKGKYLTDDLSGRAVEFVRKHKDESFFLHLAHSAPHVPLGAPEKVVRKYMTKGLDRNVATIYAMIEIMDEGIGLLMKELEKLGILDNTIVIFSSDNGPDPSFQRFNLDWTGTKYTVNEGGIRVPFVVLQNGKPHMEVDDMIHFTDVLPTLVEMCGLDDSIIKQYDGRSFAQLMSEGNVAEFEEVPLFWQWNRGVPFYTHNAAVRLGKWKLMFPYNTNKLVFDESGRSPELFDMENDSRETVDVSAQHKDVYDYLRVLFEEWRRKVEYERLSNAQ